MEASKLVREKEEEAGGAEGFATVEGAC